MTSEEIKESVNMPDVISGMYHISIKNRMCCCPFHDDRTPSMRVHEKSAYCFTCAKQWDVFSFIQDMDGVGFKDAFITLGGTYEHSDNKAVEFGLRTKREIRKAELERTMRENKRRFNEVSHALMVAEIGCDVHEPYSDEWCFYINAREYMRYVFDAIYIDGSEEYDLDVHRKCRDIEARRFQ